MSELGEFQAAFRAAMTGDAAALAPWLAEPGAAEAGLSVYRNTAIKGCVDALAMQYATLARVVGDDWLAAAAAAFAREHPPRNPVLLDYGEDFAAWLDGFAPAAAMPYLADLARIDRLHVEADLAADEPPLDPAVLAGLAADDYARLRLAPHPAARFAWFDTGVPDLWRALQAPGEAPAALELEDSPQGLLIVRPAIEVEVLTLSAGGVALLAACRAGDSLATAALQALAAEPGLALAAVFADLLEAGAFASLLPAMPQESPR